MKVTLNQYGYDYAGRTWVRMGGADVMIKTMFDFAGLQFGAIRISKRHFKGAIHCVLYPADGEIEVKGVRFADVTSEFIGLLSVAGIKTEGKRATFYIGGAK